MTEERDYDNDLIDFPMLWNCDDDEETLTFPPEALRLRELLQSGSEITKSQIYGQFRDDSLPCYNLSLTVNQEEIKFSMWHMTDATFLFALARAPFLSEDHQRVVEYVLAETDPDREY